MGSSPEKVRRYRQHARVVANHIGEIIGLESAVVVVVAAADVESAQGTRDLVSCVEDLKVRDIIRAEAARGIVECREGRGVAATHTLELPGDGW